MSILAVQPLFPGGATHFDRSDLAQKGRFKRDLLDRLSFEVLFVPPLRQRADDILLLAHHFRRRMAQELNLPQEPEFSSAAVDALLAYPWPGNDNQVERVYLKFDLFFGFDPLVFSVTSC